MMSLVLRSFEHYVAIDWSGARGARQKGIALAIASADHAPKLIRPGHIWSRQEVLDWLHDQAAAKADMLIGFDFSTGLAFHDQGAYFPHWDKSPDHITDLWALIDDISQPDADLLAASFLSYPEAHRHFRHGGGIVGDLFGQGGGRLRVVEEYQRRTGQSASVSNFNLVGAAQVGKSSLTGMRLLRRIHHRIPLWPLDSVPPFGPLIVEIYTSLAARAAKIPKGRSKIRHIDELQIALSALESPPIAPFGAITDHQSDALLTAAWMRHIAVDARYWSPKTLTNEIATQEGWTFGII